MRIQNIGNFKRKVYLFVREDNGNLNIIQDDKFYPFYYEPDNKGKYFGYDGIPLRRVIVSEPSDIGRQRSPDSYSADIKFVNNYLVHKVDKITISKPKYLFLDIEVTSPKEFPEPSYAKYPINCITIYNSQTEDYITWWLPEYENEKEMLDDFCFYVHGEAPDILLAWNIKFDYTYLHNRIKDFPKKISPVGFSRYGEGDKLFYPSGISIVDYLSLYKKVFMREASYALDYIAQKRLNEKPWPKTDFGEVSELVRDKNINDVKRMVKLETNEQLIDYYNEIRCLTKTKWEDLYFNSRIVEMLLLEEAKLKNVVLPNKEEVSEKGEFQGATRESELMGAQFNIGKFDLGSAYPNMIVNFCLDSQNIDPVKLEENIEIDGIYYSQNEEALLPSIVKKILTLKDELKIKQKKDPQLKKKYDGIKAVVNSTFGVMGNQYFRLYDNRIASSITYLVRDLIHYTRKRLKEKNVEVVYWDTDSVFTTTTEDITEDLNQYIQDWGKQYNKDKIDMKYDYEGYFTSIFFLGKCHYYGRLFGKKDPEIKGVEITRSSSSKFEASFQQNLLELILDRKTKDQVLDWIASEKNRLRTLPIEEIGFPTKIQTKTYKTVTIFKRAYDLTRTINSKFEVNPGELFYYIFVKPICKDDNVLAFKAEDKNFLDWSKHLDWDAIIERSINKKAKTIFEAQKWETSKLNNPDQLGLF